MINKPKEKKQECETYEYDDVVKSADDQRPKKSESTQQEDREAGAGYGGMRVLEAGTKHHNGQQTVSYTHLTLPTNREV